MIKLMPNKYFYYLRGIVAILFKKLIIASSTAIKRKMKV
jgi:hypothetical protein